MSEVKGIKETLELLEGLKVVAVTVKKVLADKKVNFADAGALVDLLRQYSALNEAVKGADQILPEVKDLSADEVNLIAAKVLELVTLIKV